MRVFKALALAAFGAALPLALCSCMNRIGVEPADAFIFDNTDGTMYVDKEFAKDFEPAKLSNYRKFQTRKVVLPVPYTFGTLSFGWGSISTKQIMEEGGFKRLVYAHYRRLCVVTVYTNYEITAYGE